MKILILGQKGNLGTQLEKIFKQEKDEVTGLDKDDIDITNKELILDKISQINPELIINAAAYNAVDKAEEKEEFKRAKKLNGLAPGYLAQGAAKIGAILVHYSSDYVFLGNNPDGYKEEDLPRPINNYGKSKLMGEEEIKKTTGLKYYLIRTSKLFGPQGSSPLVKPSFFDLMLKLAEEKNELKVVDEEESCFTYTKDLAQSTKKLIKEKKQYSTYHIVNPEPATWYQAAKILFQIKKIPVKLTPIKGSQFPRPAKRPKYSILLNTKLAPLRSYEEALKEYLEN